MYFWSSYVPWQLKMDKVKVIPENSCRAEARAGLSRTLTAVVSVLIFWEFWYRSEHHKQKLQVRRGGGRGRNNI